MYLKQIYEQGLKNPFVSQNLIPLGMNSYKGESKNRIICLPYYKYSGAWGLIAKSGVGKTVLLKRIYAYLLGYYQKKYKVPRPGVIFDMQSEDHHLSKFKNSNPYNLFYEQGEFPMGFENLECWVPAFIMEESHWFDRPFGFSLSDYDTRDYTTLGMGWGAAKFLSFLVKKHPDSLADIEVFFNALNNLPTNLTEFKRLSSSKYLFKLDNFMNYSSKQSMMNHFAMAYDDKVFVDDRSEFYKKSFIKDLYEGKIIVINFHQDSKYYPLYAGKILRDIYLTRRESFRSKKDMFAPPVIIIEEADLLAPKESDDNLSSIYWLKQILRRGRKYGFFTIIATQEASSMTEEVRNHTREWIIGQLADPDIPFFGKFLSTTIMSRILSLDKSKHEFCIIYEDGTFDTFYAWNSPIEIKRESII